MQAWNLHMLPRLLCLTLLALAPLAAAPGLDLDTVLAKMDSAAATFESMQATITRLKYMALLDEKTTESGEIFVRKDRDGAVRMVINFKEPYVYHVALGGNKLEIYRPRITTVEEYDIAKHRDTFQKAFLLGFGTTVDYLRKNYEIRLSGEEDVAGQKTVKLELIPKSAEVLKQVPQFDLWVSTETWQAVQQKPYQLGGEDYRIFTYTDVTLNPKLASKAFKLDIPKKAKRSFPQR